MKHLWFERGAYASKKARHYVETEFAPEKIKKIAVIRHAALGDQVIVRPFLVEARKFFPNAEITLVAVSNYMYGVPNDLVDHVHVMPGKERGKKISIKEKVSNIKQLGEQDIVFDLASTNRSHWMTALSKAKIKMGFPYKWYLRGSLFNMAVCRSDFQPEVECMMDMLKLLGHNPKRPLDFAYPSHLNLYSESLETKPKILYFNGASTKTKILSQQQVENLIKKSINALPEYQHIYLEGKNDFEKGDFLKPLTSNPNFSIKECLPLEELVDYIAKARLLVAPDTGIRNIAISTHTPTVGVFYSTVPFRYTPLVGEHIIVMNPDGSVPDNIQILDVIKLVLNKKK
ncbi:glycosyltransferase family 9 protein [Vibrio coralliilyticus]|uniref:Lipopolysaccharide biosynthesis protein n=1 Tax=Vibrio coralliilyticus TaxID=190893 RepID=A0AAN0SDP2_9VIBR|nr:glycosyltransferase family 9 protein [Vibrio coralliilyticus]AIW20320.1 lipopolysaccharide biosynthesis protein [Vibrio coralliilyticus]NOH41800.1 glycosyltransferase family 9 protein [Vibrio coralliilyticus]